MKYATPLVALCAVLALVGQGCPQQTPTPANPTTQKPPVNAVASKQAFGKLPSLTTAQVATLGTAEGVSSVAPVPSAAPAVTGSNAVAAGMPATDSVIARPIPPPFPLTGSVTYSLDAQMPTWPSEDDVLRYVSASLPNSDLAGLASSIGLPSQALGTDPQLMNFNLSWKDADDLQWSYDASSRMVSFWKQVSYPNVYGKVQPDVAQKPTTVDQKEMIRIADDFLTRKGFGNIQHGPGTLQDSYGVMPYNSTDASVRCAVPMEATGGAVSAGAGSAGTVSVQSGTVTPNVAVPPTPTNGVTTDIMPTCWWPSTQVTVVYDGMRDGKRIADAGGYPWIAVSVTIDLTDKSVTNGSFWLDRETESSKYPMITADIAAKRLESGGRNPIYPYGGNGDVTVHIKTLDLVWMRYDSYVDGGNETYLIPAIAASGTAVYADKHTEDYRTILPLVADEAFSEPTPPVPVPLPAVQTSPSVAPSAPVKQ